MDKGKKAEQTKAIAASLTQLASDWGSTAPAN